MNDNSREVPNPTPKEVLIGQEFQLFSPAETEIVIYDEDDRDIQDFSKKLSLPGFPSIPIEASVAFIDDGPGKDDYRKKTHYHPFHPESGYFITDDDFDLGKRVAKMKKADEALVEVSGNFGRLDLKLTAQGEVVDFVDVALDDKSLEDLLNQLHFQLTFPGRTYEAFWTTGLYRYNRDLRGVKALAEKEAPSSWGSVLFESYYPLDAGPLASGETKRYTPGGVKIVVPDNLDELSLVRGRFVLHPPFLR